MSGRPEHKPRPASPEDEHGPFDLYQVLEAEYESLHGKLPYDTSEPNPNAEERLRKVYDAIHGLKKPRTALCFSGGGIRSATFGLGVLQGLAKHKLLTEFDYLSTVSGGGYLGGWLSSWLKREQDALKASGSSRAPMEQIQDALNTPPVAKLEPEPEPVRHLRSYSNYMSPRFGLLSADTWTLVAIYFRNLLLNWLVLIPLIIGVLAIPRFTLAIARWRAGGAVDGGWVSFVFWVAVACGVVAIAYIIANRPSLADRPPSGAAASRVPEKYRSEWWFLILSLAPLLVLASLIKTYWAWLRQPSDQLDLDPLGIHNAFAFALFGILLYVGGYVLAQVFLLRKFLYYELIVAVITGGIGGLLTYLVATTAFDNPVSGPEPAMLLKTSLYVCFALPAFLLLFLIAATIFVGIASRKTTDADREWLARAGGWILIASGAWVVISAIVIFGPVALFYLGEKYFGSYLTPLLGVGGASGAVTLAGGASGQTAANGKEEVKQGATRWPTFLKRIALALAAPIFAVFILITLSLLTTYLYKAVYETLAGAGDWAGGIRAWLDIKATTNLAGAPADRLSFDNHGLLNILFHLPGKFVLAMTLLIVGLGVLMGFFININKFSLHGAYRDRLIRAYLGASRRRPKSVQNLTLGQNALAGPDVSSDERHPNPFTGFDESDNMAMSELVRRPLHVVNMTLNLVSQTSEQLAWQDRKAESFTSTRLFSGSFCIPTGYRRSAQYGYGKVAGRGISLGTAVAISGAAASPNMGYYSSTFVTFLLALFNVRLGWWLGNPGRAGDGTYHKSGPTYGPRALVAETLGWTDDRHPYVYLSDGGHFENLGLYEMVLRRCRVIVVSDGGADPKLTFNDLGNAISKVRDDLGIPIIFSDLPITPKDRDTLNSTQSQVPTEKYCAIGRICYKHKDPDGEDGVLIYFKPNVYGGEPADVFNYAKSNPAFPHESTGDQMYSESQFESYRMLGYYIVDTICRGGGVSDLASLEKQVCAYLGLPLPTPVKVPDC